MSSPTAAANPTDMASNAKETSNQDEQKEAVDAKDVVPTAAPVVGVDDFGLPIRQFSDSPPNPNPTVSDGDGSSQVNESEHVRDEHVEKQGKPVEVSGASNGPECAESDSEASDDFKDAESVLSSGEAPATPIAVAKPSKGEHTSTASTKTPKGEGDPGPGSEQAAQKEAPDSNHASTEVPPPETALEPTSPSAEKLSHRRDYSTASTLDGTAISEFSHQQLPEHDESQEDKGGDGWQKMPAYARYDMYDDDDKLIAKEHHDEDEDPHGYANLGGAGKGYTRVQMDEDAQSATSMDDHTQYLFKESQNSTSLTGAEEDEARDAVSQMEATKDLLTEGQRIAYVGVVRLEIAKLVEEGEQLEPLRKVKKQVTLAAESLKMWGQKMMIRLYAHMDISAAEQVMIEQLAEHGVKPADLTPALIANSTVKNPMAERRQSSASGLATSPPPYEEEKPAEPPPAYDKHEGEDLPEVKAPSELPKTANIDIDLRWTVLCDLFLVVIADSIYDARSRVLLERVGNSMDVSWLDICKFERRVTDALEMQQQAEKENWNEEEHMESRRKAALKRRYVMMGLATVGGGLVIGLSAGLLAPVIGAGLAAGFTTIGVGGTSSFLAGAGGAAIITSGAAASGSFIGGKAAHRRTGAVKTFEYRPLHNNKRVNLIVTVSGWLTGKVDDVRLPFSTVNSIMGDVYSVLWEPEMLRSMGDTINILATEALTQGLQQILGSTILISLMAALQLPLVLTKLSYLIDNPWAVSLDRATAAGKILADSLVERSLGTRPITLVGYSLGARVIFSCLQELAKKGAVGLIQNVYMFGSPIVVKREEYIRARTVVSGRFLNGYNKNDWILGYLFRLTNGGIRRIAGLAPIDEPWIENMDVTETVPGHMEYRTAMPLLLMNCGWDVESEEFTEIEDPDPDDHKGRQRELINEIEEARKELEKEGKKDKEGKGGFFSRRKKGERQEWEVYEDLAKQQGTGEGGKPEGGNHGVLFDVDAIRAELAKEAEDPEAFQIREIQSTLPPMKLDLHASPSPLASPTTPTNRSTLSVNGSKSVETLAAGPSYEPSYTSPLRQSPMANGTRSVSSSAAYPAYGSEFQEDDEIQMTFDTSFEEDARGTKTNTTAEADSERVQTRPELASAQTVPNITLDDPWGDPDDEEFGKEEKEISMTFA